MELQERKSPKNEALVGNNNKNGHAGPPGRSNGQEVTEATLSKTSFDEGGTVRRNATATLNQISADMQLSAALR